MRLFLALILCLSTAALAQEESRAVPDPLHLDPGWWAYFEVPGEEFDQHIATTTAALDKIEAALPQDDGTRARALISRIKINLNALPTTTAQQPDVPPALPAAEKSYTLDQLLELARDKKQTTAELEREKEDVTYCRSL